MARRSVLAHPILAIDTCGAIGTVALVDLGNATDTVTCIQQVELGGRSASAQLMPAIQLLLDEAGLGLASLKALLVVNGPGSFTGVRVGLSTAKGLAHATGVPIVAISRLAVLANLSEESNSLALLDAGRNEFYARRAEREWLASFDEVASAGEAGVPLLVAEAGVADRLAGWNPVLKGPLDACAAAHAALPQLLSGDRDELSTLDANYLRRSDAELFARPAASRP